MIPLFEFIVVVAIFAFVFWFVSYHHSVNTTLAYAEWKTVRRSILHVLSTPKWRNTSELGPVLSAVAREDVSDSVISNVLEELVADGLIEKRVVEVPVAGLMLTSLEYRGKQH